MKLLDISLNISRLQDTPNQEKKNQLCKKRKYQNQIPQT